MFPRARPYTSIKHRAYYRAVRGVERIQHRLPHRQCLARTAHITLLTFAYSSQTSIKNALIPSSFLPSWSSTNFMSCRDHHHHHQSVTIAILSRISLTSRRDKGRYRPLIELVHGSQIPNQKNYNCYGVVFVFVSTHIPLSRRTTSSITSRLALAIIWITCRS
jgi:hypothetical protein